MNEYFEEHIRKNKAAFDELEPSEALWHRIERGLDPAPAKLVRFSFMKYAAAAAIAGLLLLSGWLLLTRDAGLPQDGTLSAVETVVSDTNTERQGDFLAAQVVSDSTPEAAQMPSPEKPRPIVKPADKYMVNQVETDQIIEAYKNQISEQYKMLAVLKENEPLLYQKFTYDLQVLDSSFHSLKTKAKRSEQ